MKNRVECIIEQSGKIIRIHDGLLIAVGNHGVGKTNLLASIVDGRCKIVSNHTYRTVPLLLSAYDKEVFIELLDTIDDFSSFINNENDIFNKEMVLQRIPTKEVLLSKQSPYFLAYRRLVILQLLLKSEGKYAIVIDEPELFAHPLIVRDICSLLLQLQKKGNLIIMATNSETIVSKMFVDIEQVVRLEEKRGIIQVNAEQLIKDVQDFYYQDIYLTRRFSQASQIDIGLQNILSNYVRIYLSSIFNKQMYAIMHSDCVILGEGSSEDVLFDYIDQVLQPKWMREYRVHYMGCLGKSSMPFYFLFLNHLQIKKVCLFDKDNEQNRVHAAYAQSFKNYEQSHKSLFAKMILDPNLEHVLDIVPEYTLMSIEKPINIYHHTFGTNGVVHKVEEISNLMKLLFEEMDERGSV